jgi:hypothetical protein
MALIYETPNGEVIHISGPRRTHSESDETLYEALLANREFLASVPKERRSFLGVPSPWEVAAAKVMLIEREMRRRGICQE